VEYYIIASDKVAVRVTNELINARQRGVHVYLIYDAHGSRLFRSEGDFFAKLKLRGLGVAGFLPFSSFFQNYNLNHRNHRKLLLIDGRVAFSGGTNLGSEYIGRWHKRQQHDYTFKIQGPICSQLQRCFSLDWKFTTGHSPDLTQITTRLSDEPAIGNAEIQILPSGPDTKMPVFYTAALQLIATAQHSVRCITPYFIPDTGFSHALMSAAKRGVNVEMILPSKIDWMSVLWASRSYWDELITNGVHIHQYPPVLLHAKMIIIDEKWLIFGSSNLDVRSFHLNFELDFLVKEPQAIANALAEFKEELNRCQRVDPHLFLQRAKIRRFAENFCRIFSPLL
jgi:cardiolipin synthase